MENIPLKSVWSETATENPRPTLSGNIKTDVLIIGAGMAGILTAWRLKKAGISCVVAEAKTVGSGVTKNTTAKITAQHGIIYDELIRQFGREKSQMYYAANSEAIAEYKALATKIPCDLEEKTAYVYSRNSNDRLMQEARAYEKLGIGFHIEKKVDLPFQNYGAIAIEKQAQFNPLKLIYGLSSKLDILENTFVKAIDGNRAITENGIIEAKHIVLATHFPMINIPGLFFLKLYQHRSYVLAIENAQLLDGMYIDEQENGLSFRTYDNLLFVGGGGHKTGKEAEGFETLNKFIRENYSDAHIKYRWATQDCMTLDSVPYIGRHRASKQNLYVSTGFNKWGMTGAMVASKVLCDLITKGSNSYEELFSPSRSIMTKQLAVNVGSAAVGLFSIGGPRCTHMGCKLHKNEAERTWDCACHGSRFTEDGDVINNPAKRGINL